ncbi:hypothetical protein WN51_08249 [Melipona quadrifasciata]|uniref:Uncharacterized protein n=1 Tax=Melipona quadrifasciata TaxID=166423 RepID=A0A0N0BBB7_9HYME|nr:hypothetical protein WN51_08249 [Melipona quadrifasciata]
MKRIRSDVSDISQFERRLREIIYEHQRNAVELNNLEKERLSIREELCLKDHLLQNERRISSELKTRLKTASLTINRLEEERMRDKIDYTNLSVNYETLLQERDIFKKEALSCRTEAAKFKFKVESLEGTLRREIRQREKLEQALTELKNDYEKITVNIDKSIVKLGKEQEYLLDSSKAIILLNKRLQTFGLCSHAINQRNKARERDLQRKLIASFINKSTKLSSNDALHPEIENLCSKLKEMLTNLKTKMQDSASFEEKLDRIFNEFSANFTQVQQTMRTTPNE